MADGTTKPISELAVGDRVLAVDSETGLVTDEAIEGVWTHTDWLVVLEVDGGVIATTEDHLFWDVTDGHWEEAQQLERGDRLLAADGSRVRVLGIVAGLGYHGEAWNLTVSGPATYQVSVGSRQVLVHNCPIKAYPRGASHARSFRSSVPATLYKKLDIDGKFLKYGVSSNLGKRYTLAELAGGKLEPFAQGARRQMVVLERWLVERYGGPENREPWSRGRRRD
jgi:hypothetical protein